MVDSHRTRRRRDDNLETLGKCRFHFIFCYAMQALLKKRDFKAIYFPLESIYIYISVYVYIYIYMCHNDAYIFPLKAFNRYVSIC